MEFAPDEGGGVCHGWVLDRSLGGLRLMIDQEWSVGKVIGVRVREKSAFMPWIEVQVKHCKPSTHGWEVGCQFVNQPTWNMLLMFG